METSMEAATNFLQNIFDETGLQLNVTAAEDNEQCVLDIDGPDADLLQSAGGELLEALQHLVAQAYGRSLPTGQRIVCDVRGFRATREAELRAMANHAATQVRTTRNTFTFGPMSAAERRVIHLALAESEDLYTESLGEGSDRKLRVGLKQ